VSYKVNIGSLTFDCIIGILDFERVNEQKVVIDCSFEYEKKDQFIDYVIVRNMIKDMMISNRYELLEDAIDDITKVLYQRHPQMHSLHVKISKPDILNDCIVSVESA
jgi:dihydroneopterin aldolase